jgi:hypothetical protein
MLKWIPNSHHHTGHTSLPNNQAHISCSNSPPLIQHTKITRPRENYDSNCNSDLKATEPVKAQDGVKNFWSQACVDISFMNSRIMKTSDTRGFVREGSRALKIHEAQRPKVENKLLTCISEATAELSPSQSPGSKLR